MGVMTPDDDATPSIGEIKQRLTDSVTTYFLDSNDFNGLPAQRLIPKSPDSAAIIEELLTELVADGVIYANFGHKMVNPHIIGFQQEEPAENLAQVRKRAGIGSSVLYPTAATLEQAGAADRYPDAPYSRQLVLGEGQLESRFFHGAVLARYRDDPRYEYAFDINGHIRGSGAPMGTFLTTFGIGYHRDTRNPEIVVGVPLRYLHDLLPVEQSYWLSFQHDQQDFILHPDWVRPNLYGEFPEKISAYTAILDEMELINRICDAIGYTHLYRTLFTENSRPTDYGYVIRPTDRELSNFYEQLNKLLIDNMQPAFFDRTRVERTQELKDGEGNTYRGPRGTVAMLEDFLKDVVTVDSEGMVPDAVATLRKIRKYRSSVAHDIKVNSFDPAIWESQRQLVASTYFAVRTIRQLLGCHPDASEVTIPEALERPLVWLL